MVRQDGGVYGLQIGVAGELDLKDIKQGDKAGVKHIPGTPRRTHGTHKLDVLHVHPVQFLAAVIEPLEQTNNSQKPEAAVQHLFRKHDQSSGRPEGHVRVFAFVFAVRQTHNMQFAQTRNTWPRSVCTIPYTVLSCNCG